MNAASVSVPGASLIRRFFRLAALLLLAMVVLLAGAAGLLWFDARQVKNEFFDARKGEVVAASVSEIAQDQGQRSDLVRLRSDTGLAVTLRVLRPSSTQTRLPVLLILGGHRTGSRAVQLLGTPEKFALVVMDYPYHGPQSIHGLLPALRHLPGIRRALLDTPPAVSLVVDWLEGQPWLETQRIIMVGVSLGAPFAATAAARDTRLSELWLVHGAADNRLWLQANLARRIQSEALRSVLATVLMWVANGPTFDTTARVAAISPRPVLIVGARSDEKTPPGQTEQLFEAASEPKSLRWTDGGHVRPGRDDVIGELLGIARQQLANPEPGLSR